MNTRSLLPEWFDGSGAMVELKSSTHPTTIPHQYKVELLTTQYRSIPEIGEVFRRFAYGGVLKHNRTTESQHSHQPLILLMLSL
ncbi:MAG: hypothetical protein Q8911_12250 [Bacillota bacterium]|nr:hypothetical protein [Bacillota bacterium]